MRRIFVLLLLIVGVGAYLHYVRGWDWTRARQAVERQVPFLDRSATTTPIGSRGTGTRWEIAAAMPTPRSGIGAAEIGGKIYVVGGLNGFGGTLSLLEIYDIEKDAWSVGQKMPQALHHPAVATDGLRLYVFGGLTGLGGRPVDAAFVYNPANKGWDELPRLDDFRGAAAAAFDGRTGYMLGGVNQSGPTNAVEQLDPTGAQWDAAPRMRSARQLFSSAALGGKIFALGGRTLGNDTNMSQVEVLDPAKGRWEQAPPMTRARGAFAAAPLGGKIYAFGGEEPGATLDTVDVFDPATGRWDEMHLVMPTARHGLAAVPYKNRVYVIGGGKRTGFSVSDQVEVLIVEGIK